LPNVPKLAGPPIYSPYTNDRGLLTQEWQDWFESPAGPGGILFSQVSVDTITSDTTLTARYQTVIANTTAAALTITLPSSLTVFEGAVGSGRSRSYYIRNDGPTNIATLVPVSGETIDGATSKIIPVDGSFFVLTDGANWFTFLLSSPSRVEVFTVSGTWTWQGETSVEVTLQGGGGGGGAAAGNSGGGGGASGELIVRTLNVSADVVITIGGGGAGGPTSSSDGSDGVDSTFGPLLKAAGGSKGFSASTLGGAASTNSTFGANMRGGQGGPSIYSNGETPERVVGLGDPGTAGAVASSQGGGGGGGGGYGDGGNGGSNSVGVDAAVNSGGGGGGGAGSKAGGAGGSGICIVRSLG
jgi:hypothetical protein